MEPVPDRFRQVMGHFATGISVVTTFDGDRPAGITVNAFSSVSLEPPLVMVALDRRRFITPMVRAVGRYAVSVLGADQQPLSDCFAHAPVSPGREDFCGAMWHAGPTGLPLIDDSIATLECTVVETFSAGDHDLFIGRVDSLEQHRDGVAPLLYFRRRYLRIEQGAESAVEGKPEGSVPTLRANGLDIGYDVRGAGPPLILLHGATSLGAEDYAAQLPKLTTAFLVHLPDARGHGRTRWDAAEGFRYDWLVDDLTAFVDGLGIDSFHALGFSMGAMTALQFGARYPERLRTLVAVGITTLREPRASVGRRLMDPARILAREPEFAAALGRRHDAGQGAGAWQRLLPAIAADIAAQPLLAPAELHRIDCPAMVVCGDRDPFVPPEHAAGLARQLPHGRLFIAPDCGHEVMARRPGLFNEALSAFYRATEAEALARGARAERAGTTQGGSP